MKLESSPVLATIADVLGDGEWLTAQQIVERTYRGREPDYAEGSVRIHILRLRREFGFNIVSANTRGYRLERRSA